MVEMRNLVFRKFSVLIKLLVPLLNLHYNQHAHDIVYSSGLFSKARPVNDVADEDELLIP